MADMGGSIDGGPTLIPRDGSGMAHKERGEGLGAAVVDFKLCVVPWGLLPWREQERGARR